MNEQELPPLDADTLSVLRAEKTPPGAPSDVAARVMTRLAVNLQLPAPNGGPVDHVAAGAGASARGALAMFTPSVRVGTAFFAGIVAGAAGHAWIGSPRGLAVSMRESPALSATVALSNVPPQSKAEPAREGTAPSDSTSVATEPSPAGSSGASDLRAERAMLDQAQRALARGDATTSWSVLTAHTRRFPHGRLEEEREALAVKTLAALGRNDEAKARGARFRARYPDSLLRSTIDDTLGTIP
ncbi:MAG: hypothetical protein ABW133_13310 [Polyangiaceae bacterium]